MRDPEDIDPPFQPNAQ